MVSLDIVSAQLYYFHCMCECVLNCYNNNYLSGYKVPAYTKPVGGTVTAILIYLSFQVVRQVINISLVTLILLLLSKFITKISG